MDERTLLDIYLGLHSAIEGKTVGPEFIPYSFPDEDCLKLHVIGECQDCFFKEKSNNRPDSKLIRCVALNRTFYLPFGCFHWTKKNSKLPTNPDS